MHSLEAFNWDIDSIEKSMPNLKKQYTIIKNQLRYPQFVTGLFRETMNLLSRAKAGDKIATIKIVEKINVLNLLIRTPEQLDLEMISLLTDTSNQISIFKKYSLGMDDKTYWKELRSAYQLQDYKKLNHKLLAELFNSSRPSRESMLTKKEREVLLSLPSEVIIYRGCYSNELKLKNYGISWTLSRKVAEFFANRPTKKTPGTVVQLTIPKERIIAYFKDRKEDEVIYIPDWINIEK